VAAAAYARELQVIVCLRKVLVPRFVWWMCTAAGRHGIGDGLVFLGLAPGVRQSDKLGRELVDPATKHVHGHALPSRQISHAIKFLHRYGIDPRMLGSKLILACPPTTETIAPVSPNRRLTETSRCSLTRLRCLPYNQDKQGR
jgi:hypothetical protein